MIKNNLVGNNNTFGYAANIELTGGPGRALSVQSHGNNSNAIYGIAWDNGIAVGGNSIFGYGAVFGSNNYVGLQAEANNQTAIQAFNNSSTFPSGWFYNYYQGGVALKLYGNMQIEGKIIQEAYQSPAFENNWSNYGGDWATAKFYKSKEGRVYLEGTINGGNNPKIYTLPAGYRPNAKVAFMVTINGSERGRIEINSNGEVYLANGPTTQVSLDGISFRVE